jgi:hypothetical protein
MGCIRVRRLFPSSFRRADALNDPEGVLGNENE